MRPLPKATCVPIPTRASCRAPARWRGPGSVSSVCSRSMRPRLKKGAARASRAACAGRAALLPLCLPRSEPLQESDSMPHYTPPLRDMQFVLHEVLNVVDELKQLPRHADVDAETINAVIEEGGKFASQVLVPLNQSGDIEGCSHDKVSHEVKAPAGFKQAYAQYI